MTSSAIIRQKAGNDFVYFKNGRQVKSKSEIERIKKLAIPPAWQNVEIAAGPQEKIQATGLDNAGRKQYIYHPSFRTKREKEKFDRILSFANKLPKLRRQVTRDLKRQKFDKRKVTAAAISLMDNTYFRVGNEQYAKAHHSYGLTTLRSEHVSIRGNQVTFDFDGKSKQHQHKKITDKGVAKIVKRLDELPGRELFRYFDDRGELHNLKSTDINEYIKSVMGRDYSAKDFRTWGGTMLAALELSKLDRPETKTARTKAVSACIKKVSARLGNTPAITRGSYIDPRIIDLFNRSDKVREIYRTAKKIKQTEYFNANEQCVVKILSTNINQ